MLTDDDEIGKRASWRNRQKMMWCLYVYLHLICHLFIIIYRY